MSINWIPKTFEKANIVAEEAATGLFERLSWMTLQPSVILEVGCGPAHTLCALQKRFPDAQIVGMDLSDEMLKAAKNDFPGVPFMQATMEALPFKANTVDLIFTNMVLPWSLNYKKPLQEFARLLKPDGVLMLSCLGPDTCQELAGTVLSLVPSVIDMHDMGDELLKIFADPVLDVDYLSLCYGNTSALITELIASGMIHQPSDEVLKRIPEQGWETTYEIIFAHAFGKQFVSESTGEVKISVDVLRKQLPKQS